MTTSVLTVRETIRHGDYCNVRTCEMPATWDGFVAMLLESPYNGGKHSDDYAKNPYAARLFADLLNSGRGELGWANYERIRW